MRFTCDIYPIRIWLDIEEEGDGIDAWTQYGDGCGSTITLYRKGKTDWREALLHEVVHAVSHGLRDIGIKHTKQTEETYAYMIQFFYFKILKRLERDKKFI